MKKNQKLLAGLFVGVVIVFLSYSLRGYGLTTIYSSTNNHFMISVPSGYSVVEKFNTATFSRQGSSFDVTSTGTNFSDVDEYLDDMFIKNKLVPKPTAEALSIDAGLPARSWESASSKNVTILSGDSVYSLSTSSPALYDELEQIAKSFRYTGK